MNHVSERDWQEFVSKINRDGLLLMVLKGVTKDNVRSISEWRKYIRIETTDGKRVHLTKRGCA